MKRSLIPGGNVLVVLFVGNGDLFLALPLLREIKKRFSGHKVYLACYADQIDALLGDLDVEFLPSNSFHSINRPFVALLERDLDDLDIQQIVSLNHFFPNSVDLDAVACFPNASRFAFWSPSGEPLVAAIKNIDRHMRDFYYEAVGWDASYSLADRQVFIPDDRREIVRRLCDDWSSRYGELFYVMHMDSDPKKMWSVDKWMELISLIWTKWEAWPLILGKETKGSESIQTQFNFALKLSSNLGMAAHFAAVDLGPVFIGIDSIFAHIADSYNKPMAVLMGSTNPIVWRPKGPLSFIVRPDRANELGKKSLNETKDILVSEVVNRADDLFISVLASGLHRKASATTKSTPAGDGEAKAS